MEEKNQSSQDVSVEVQEPIEKVDNSQPEADTEVKEVKTQEIAEKGSKPEQKLILGKFKSTEDLMKAYQELEKLQGTQSAELGSLRENSAAFNAVKNLWNSLESVKGAEKELRDTCQKYNTYFQDPSFRKFYKSAYMALGSNLDTEQFVNLLEEYVSARIFAHEKNKSMSEETKRAVESLNFDKNEKPAEIKTSKKRVEDMNPKEYEEFLQRLI